MGKLTRPEIVVDLDNVVYDWVWVMAQLAEYEGYIPSASDAYNNYSSWNVWEDWGMAKGAFYRMWRRGIEDGVVYGQGPIMMGAREALWLLSDHEFHITIATSRLNQFGMHKQVVDNTVEWLNQAQIPYRSLMFTDNKGIAGARYLIDDSPRHLEQVVDGQTPILFDSPHNQDETGFMRARTWADVLFLIGEGANG